MTFHFPPYQALLRCLEKHPSTQDPYLLKEKGIIKDSATFFADMKNYTKEDIQRENLYTMVIWHERNNKTILPNQRTLTTININLAQALQDCAKGKPASLKKNS